MQFFKLTFSQIPKLVFAHQFSAHQYEMHTKSGNFIEITYIDSGALSRRMLNEPQNLAAGDFLITPPCSDWQVAVIPQGAFHSHSTVAFTCEAEAEFCSGEDLLNCKFMYHNQNTPDELKNFFVFPLTFQEEGHVFKDKIKEIINQSKQHTISNPMLLSGYFLELCYLLTQKSLALAEGSVAKYIPPSNMLYCKKILDYIAVNYQSEIHLETLSELVGLNKNYMCEVFKKTMKQSIVHYLIRYRINKAKELMSTTDDSIGKIAQQVGIENEAYFSRLFNKYEAMSPAKFRAFSLRGTFLDLSSSKSSVENRGAKEIFLPKKLDK